MAKSKTAQRGRQPGKGGPHGRPGQRARAIEARKTAEAMERRRRLRSALIFGTVLLVAIGAIAGGVLYSLGKDDRKLPAAAVASGVDATKAPPWVAPADPTPLIAQASLRSAQSETFGEHFHAHLDILVDGKPVTLPGNIGIGTGPTGNIISEVHTHGPDGIIHVEAPDKTRRYVLGQLLTELGIKLDASTLGSFTAGNGKTLAGYVDGKKFDGNPAQIELKNHREIALVFGTPEQQQNPPATFDWDAHNV